MKKSFEQFITESKDDWMSMGTSPSLEMMKKLLGEFFYTSPSLYSFKLIDSKPETYEIIQQGKTLGGRIVKDKNRYRFEIPNK